MNMTYMLYYPLLMFLVIFSCEEMCYAADSIDISQALTDSSNKTLISSGGSFEMGFFSPENSDNRYIGIWYKTIAVQTVIWVGNRENPLTDRLGALQVSQLGVLLLLNATNATIWSTNHTSTSLLNPVAQLLDSGNLVLRDANDDNPQNFLWQSFDYPTDTSLPGMKLGMNFKTGLEVYLTSWKSTSDPSQGDYTLHFDSNGYYPQLTIKKGLITYYKSGPWNGVGFSGLPILKNNTIFSFGVVMNNEEVYYHYELLNKSVITRLTMSEGGEGQRLVWLERTHEWNSHITMPVDNCDKYKGCGPYGSCYIKNSSSCGCLKKFKPKDPQGWDDGDYANGCIRSTAFACGNDAFLKYSGMKLPDTEGCSWYNETMSIEECKRSCSKNCSCTAYARLNMSSGNGCLLWFGDLLNMRDMTPLGQDIYIRMASSDLEKKKRKILGVALSLVIGILLLSLCLSVFQYSHKRMKRYHQLRRTGLVKSDESHHILEIPRFDLATICTATNNFSRNNMLGQGGYGTVYKGVLDGQEVAVKCLSRNSLQGVDEFMNEVRSIAKLQHRNLVKLLGCCIEGEERILIYEYLSNKSLDLILFDSTRRTLLDWPKRSSIINNVARGLQYLHEDSCLRVIHRDLKTANILLDSAMKPKISDFGLAKTFGGNETGDVTGRLMGTYGYLAPEYVGFGRFSVKSDVYSFGVIVLEIISGIRNRGFPNADGPGLNLLGNAWKLHREGKLQELMDPGLETRHLVEILRSIHIGLLCVQEHPDERPSMSSIVVMLSNSDVVLPEPRHPAVLSDRTVETSASKNAQELVVFTHTTMKTSISTFTTKGSISGLWIPTQYKTY